MTSSILTGALIALVMLASWQDVRSRRIPNVLTLSGVCVALALHSFGGPGAVAGGLLGAGLALLITLPLFALGGMGGGDVKLLIAVGAFLGPQRFLVALLVTALVGGVMAVVQAARQRRLLPVLLDAGALTRHHLTLGRGGARPELVMTGARSIPYAVAIAAGALYGWFA